MEQLDMFDEDKYYWTIVEKLLDAYDISEILLIADVDQQEALVELMLAGVLKIDLEDFFDIDESVLDDAT